MANNLVVDGHTHILVWDQETGGIPAAIYKGASSSNTRNIKPTKNGRFAFCIMERTPYLICVDLETNTLVSGLPTLPAVGKSIALSPDDLQLAVYFTVSPYLLVYNIADWTQASSPLGAAAPNANYSEVMAYSPDGTLLAGSNGSTLYVYNTSDWSLVAGVASAGASIVSGEFTPDGAVFVVTLAAAGHIAAYDTSTWALIPAAVSAEVNYGDGGALSPDGSRYAVVAHNSPYLYVYDTSDWSRVIGTPAIGGGRAYQCVYGPEGKTLVIMEQGDSPYVRVFDTTTWEERPLPVVSAFVTWRPYALAFASSAPRFIRGTVRDETGTPVKRTVRAYARATGDRVGETESDAISGDYEFILYGAFDTEYDIQFMAPTVDALNDLFYARSTSGNA